MLPDTKNTGNLYRHWTYETYQCCALPVFAHELGSQSLFLLSLLHFAERIVVCNWLSFLQVFLAFFQQFLETIVLLLLALIFASRSCLFSAVSRDSCFLLLALFFVSLSCFFSAAPSDNWFLLFVIFL